MKQSIAKKFGIGMCAAALCVALVGCGPAGSTATEAQKANRAYMSQVNETMVELDESLDGFVDAVSRGDVVNMRNQADNAYKVLDKLAGIQAPEELKGVREDYVNGTTKLRDALDRYIALYTEMKSDTSLITQADYDTRIAEIQALYDEGVALLQKGDATVAGSGAAPLPSASASSTSTSSDAAATTTQSAESASSQMSATPEASESSSASADAASSTDAASSSSSSSASAA